MFQNSLTRQKDREGLEHGMGPELRLERIEFASILVNQADCRRVRSVYKGNEWPLYFQCYSFS